MELRMKHVYTLRGAMIASRFFPALKRAAEGHFDGLIVELLTGDEIGWYQDSGQRVDPQSETGKLLSAWYQGWLNGFLVSVKPEEVEWPAEEPTDYLEAMFADGRY